MRNEVRDRVYSRCPPGCDKWHSRELNCRQRGTIAFHTAIRAANRAAAPCRKGDSGATRIARWLMRLSLPAQRSLLCRASNARASDRFDPVAERVDRAETHAVRRLEREFRAQSVDVRVEAAGRAGHVASP